MAILMLIKNQKEGLMHVNDVAGVFNDTHTFSEYELKAFNFLNVNGSKEDVQELLRTIQPETHPAFYYDGEWHFHPPENPELIEDEIMMYRVEGSKKWYQLVVPFKYSANIDDLSTEEKQLLETYDINHSSIDSFIKKIAKDITLDEANQIEITDLRNVNP